MKTMKPTLIFITLLVLVYIPSNAQHSTNASGGDASGNNGSVSYTIGQVFYKVNNSNAGQVLEGVQLPYEFIMIGIEKAPGIQLLCFPNPTTGYLTLKAENDLGNLSYQLFDTKGIMLLNKPLTGIYTRINMQKYPPGIYFIKAININKTIKTFKIIKNQNL